MTFHFLTDARWDVGSVQYFQIGISQDDGTQFLPEPLANSLLAVGLGSLQIGWRQPESNSTAAAMTMPCSLSFTEHNVAYGPARKYCAEGAGNPPKLE
jgi:hypothetical protein